MKRPSRMRKPLGRHHKLIAASMAVVAAAGLVTGTLAWGVKDKDSDTGWFSELTVGANMHDDFDGRYNRDIYVENFAQADVYVRVQLREYLEMGAGANMRKLPTTATKNNVRSWEIHYQNHPTNSFSEWWKWTQGSTAGERYYLPTDPDAANREEIQKPGAPNNYSPEYFYDKAYAEAQSNLGLRPTLGARVMTMAQWKALSAAEKIGNYWVGDTDGWYYWAAPLAGGTATGLLLNSVELTKKIGNPYYYGINATFEGADDEDIGKMWEVASNDAKDLLETISEYKNLSKRLLDAINRATEKLAEATANPGRYTTDSVNALQDARDAAAVVRDNNSATDAQKSSAIDKINEKINLTPTQTVGTALELLPPKDPVSLGYPASVGLSYGNPIITIYNEGTLDPNGVMVETDNNLWYDSNLDVLNWQVGIYRIFRPGSIALDEVILNYDDTKPTTVTALDPRFRGTVDYWGNDIAHLGEVYDTFEIGTRWDRTMWPDKVDFLDVKYKTSILCFYEPPPTLGNGKQQSASFYALHMTAPLNDPVTGESYLTTVIHPGRYLDDDNPTGPDSELHSSSPIITTDVILTHQGKSAKIRVSYVVSRHNHQNV